MTKDAQQHAAYANAPYPTQMPQMPSAPPTYDEAMHPQVAQHYQYFSPPPTVMAPPVAGSSYYVPPMVEVQRTIVTLPLGPNPARIKCPQCCADVLTRTETEPSCSAHLCCLLIFLIGCCPFSSLPYFMDSMKNVQHRCPSCNVYLGSYQP